jgi:Bacterial antitoxin of type II TA system, VapB
MVEEPMRTTVVLKDDLVKKARKLSREPTLSALLNSCLADRIAQHSRRELKARLLEEYRSGRQESRRISREFAHTDKEGWPSW